MLTLALTRPRLRWMEQLTEGSDSRRLWAERVLTFFLLVMAGYAAVTLALALDRQLGGESGRLLTVAGVFLFVYGWLVHFEPFVREWHLRGGFGAGALYTAVVGAAVAIGALLTEAALKPWFSLVELALVGVAVVFFAIGWGFYKWGPDYYMPLGRLLKNVGLGRTRSSHGSPERDEPS
jgi:hypothetical protein